MGIFASNGGLEGVIMNKPKLILTPVGALIVNRLTQDEKPLWGSVQKEDLPAIREGQAKGQKALEQKVVTRLKTLDLTTEEGLQQASPEIKSLVKIGVGPEDQIVLYASETPDGILITERGKASRTRASRGVRRHRVARQNYGDA